MAARWRLLRHDKLKMNSTLSRVIFSASEVNEESNRSSPAGGGTTTSATPVAWPSTAPLTVTFTKLYDDSRLIAYFGGTAYINSGTAVGTWGVTINGTNYDLAKFFFNVALIHDGVSGVCAPISGVPAGTYVCDLTAKVTANTLTNDANDFNSLSVREVS